MNLYLAVDKDKSEWIFLGNPKREVIVWIQSDRGATIPLPKGSIERLIERKITWKDNAIFFGKVKIDDRSYDNEPSYDKNKIALLIDMINTMQDYINLLGKELDDCAVMLSVHGWQSKRVQEGIDIRNKMNEINNKLKQ